VPRTASFADIQRAYRKLAIKHHPSANESDAEAERKFIEVNEAYSHLCNVFRRRNYDDVRFGEIQPYNAHNIFMDFFRTNPELFEDDVQLFSEILGSKKPLTSLKEPDVDALAKDATFVESFKSQTIKQDGPGGPVGRTITSKKSIKDGKKYEISTDEILKPNGTKVVTETVKEDGKVKVNKYEVGPGETRKELPCSEPTCQKALPQQH
jgi:curved DNA-binding protein CbpA